MAAGGTPSAGSTPAPIVAPPVGKPFAPVVTPTATPSSTPQGGKGGNPTSNGPTQTPSVLPQMSDSGFGDPRGYANNGMAPTAPQQPYVNPFMQTYGQNNTPQQQTFNRFQPQQYGNPYGRFGQGFPQQGNFGRGFMPQNRGGYERQMDQLRGGYNRPMPPMMQNNPQPDAAYNTYMQSLPEYAQQQDLQKQMAALSAKMEADPQGTTMRNALQANARQIMPQQDMGYGGGYGRFNMDRGQQQSPPNAIQELSRDEIMRQYDAAKANQVNNPSGQQQGMQQAAFMNSLLKGQPLSGQPATGQTPIPAYAQPYATSLANQPNTPAGGKGGNPTAGGLGNGGNPAPINGLYDPGYR